MKTIALASVKIRRRLRLKVNLEVSQVAFMWILAKVGSQLGEKPEDQSPLGEQSGGDNGIEPKKIGEEGEISEAGISVGVLFDKLDTIVSTW